MDFVAKANQKSIALYTSELAIYEAIPILLQEKYYALLLKQGVIKSFRRIQHKISSDRISVTIRRELAPSIESIRESFQVMDFDDLPPATHENAQKIALSSTFMSFDALHLAIAKYLSESNLDKDGSPLAATCYIITNNTNDFSSGRFVNEVKHFTENIKPIVPEKALNLI